MRHHLISFWSFNEKFYSHNLVFILMMRHFPNRSWFGLCTKTLSHSENLLLGDAEWTRFLVLFLFFQTQWGFLYFSLKLAWKLASNFFPYIFVAVPCTWLKETDWHFQHPAWEISLDKFTSLLGSSFIFHAIKGNGVAKLSATIKQRSDFS